MIRTQPLVVVGAAAVLPPPQRIEPSRRDADAGRSLAALPRLLAFPTLRKFGSSSRARSFVDHAVLTQRFMKFFERDPNLSLANTSRPQRMKKILIVWTIFGT